MLTAPRSLTPVSVPLSGQRNLMERLKFCFTAAAVVAVAVVAGAAGAAGAALP